jgi:nicotinate-nucleotide adenylyltransferase
MKKNQIAVFGSALNPPHRGHEDVIIQILQHTNSVILIPSYKHAFGKQMMPYHFRMKMVEAMISEMHIGEKVRVSDIEKRLANSLPTNQPIYTYDVLHAMEQELNNNQLTFVVGPDNADPNTWKKFYKADAIIQRWNIWAAEERINVRSTLIRQKLAQGVTLNNQECCDTVIQLLSQRN